MKKLRLFFLLVLTTPVYSQVPVNSNNFNGATIPQKPEFESLSDSVFEKKLLQEVIITSKKSVSFESEVKVKIGFTSTSITNESTSGTIDAN